MHIKPGKQAKNIEKHAEEVKESAKMVEDRQKRRYGSLDKIQKRLSRKWGKCKLNRKNLEWDGTWKIEAKKARKEMEVLLFYILRQLRALRVSLQTVLLCRASERIVGAQGKYKKWGPYWSGGTPPENFEILHALKCVLRASQVPFCACIQYIPTCQLPSLFSGIRSKSTTYGGPAAQRSRIRLY